MVRKVFFLATMSLLAWVVSCGDVLEDNISKKQLNLLSPGDDITITNDTVSFWWDHLAGATEYELHLVSPSLANPVRVLLDTITRENLLNYKVASGTYEWELRALNSGYATDYLSRSFEVDLSSDSLLTNDISGESVNLLVPQDQAALIGTSVNFNWEKLDGAKQYEFWLVSPNFTNPEVVVVDTTLNSSSFGAALKSGDYEWRVRALNDEFETNYVVRSFRLDSAEVVDISAEVVELITPQNDATLYGGNVSFNWSEVSDAHQYHFQIFTPSIANPVQIVEDVYQEGTSVDVALESGYYEWRVKAENGNSETAWFSAEFTLDSEFVEDISAEIVVLRAPADGLVTSNHDINFWWDELSGADEYELLIATPSFDDDKIEMLVYETTTGQNKMTVNLDSGAYEWGVRALNSRFSTAQSIRAIHINTP